MHSIDGSAVRCLSGCGCSCVLGLRSAALGGELSILKGSSAPTPLPVVDSLWLREPVSRSVTRSAACSGPMLLSTALLVWQPASASAKLDWTPQSRSSFCSIRLRRDASACCASLQAQTPASSEGALPLTDDPCSAEQSTGRAMLHATPNRRQVAAHVAHTGTRNATSRLSVHAPPTLGRATRCRGSWTHPRDHHSHRRKVQCWLCHGLSGWRRPSRALVKQFAFRSCCQLSLQRRSTKHSYRMV